MNGFWGSVVYAAYIAEEACRLLQIILDILFNYVRKVGVFKFVDSPGESLWGVIFKKRALRLEQNLSAVVIFINKVDCNA